MIACAFVGALALTVVPIASAFAAPVAPALAPTTAADASVASPATAGDAPWTKTVTYLVSQLTPTEKTLLVRGGTDPDTHGQAGYVAPIARLGIPEVRHADALGINVSADATGFPSRIGIASSFDRSAYTMLGQQVGKEGKALDVDLIYGPQVDMSRYPSWTRNLTTNGEDAYVSAQFASAEINAIQSEDLMSQVKHVSMYNGQNQSTPSLVSSQAAHEVYLSAAQSAIEDGGVSSLMCSYATFRIVGEQSAPQFACQNPNLLNNIVKGQFGLKGFITSDYTASHATSDILQGMDQEFASSNLTTAKLLPLIDVTSSSYDPAYAVAVDNADARILYEMERFGLLDNSKIPAQYQSSVPQHGNVASTFNGQPVDKAVGEDVALQLAEESAVLLKNDASTLPLAKTGTVAAIGPAGTVMPSAPGGERSRGFGDRNNLTPVKGIKAIAGTSNVVSAPGIDWLGTTVPASALKQDSAGTLAGLVRTTVTNDAVPVTTTSVDTTVAGTQTNLVKGYKYTWTGYVNVTSADTYQFLLQRPYGTDSGNTAAYNGGVRPAAAGTVSLSIDGATRTLAAPSAVVLQNDYPDGTLASNGQYLGKDNTGASVALQPGLHQVTFTYNPATNAAQVPTLRFAWAPLAANTAAAVAAAQTNDTSVVFLNSENAGSGPSSSTSAGLAVIPQAQVDLFNTVADAAHAAGHKVVVVLNTGSAVAMPWADKADAILNMWYPGQEGGTATANLLYGVANPSGKLPITFPVDDNHTEFTDHPERTSATTVGSDPASFKWTEGVDLGYRWYTDPAANVNGYQPRYAFGFGLSYTTFDYSGLSVTYASDGGLNVSYTVTNTGSREGSNSSQVYIGASPDLKAPVYDANGLVTDGFQQSAQKLVQFGRVDLAAGESKTLSLHVDLQSLSAWDTKGQNWVVGTGDRTISIGQSSEDLPLTTSKDVTTTAVAPAITTNPAASVTASVGDTITLQAAASGSPAPTVQWESSLDAGQTWNPITGAQSGTYSFTASAGDNGHLVRATFTNELGSESTVPTTINVTRPALTAPSGLTASGSSVLVVGGTTFAGGPFTLKWNTAAPAGSLGGYAVLDNGTQVGDVLPSSTLSTSLTLPEGVHSLTVKAVALDGLVIGGDKTSAAVSVTVDKTAPVVTLTKPASPDQSASWGTINGTVTDAGVGVKSVTVQLVQLRSGSYLAYDGKGWNKAASLVAAQAAAKPLAATITNGTWSLAVAQVKAGTLYISYSAADALGNTSSQVTETYVLIK